jgi:gamma-glutamyltranspeptidase/glutathione hydrolase
MNMDLKKLIEALSQPYRALRGLVVSERGVVGTAHPLASATGAGILQSGGNFIDAALAVSAVLNVVEPYNSQLGGDAFMLVYTGSDGDLTAVNSSGPAPRSASLGDFHEGVPIRGMASASVPGQVGAWELIHERYATMEWSELLAPSIRYAREGFPVNPRFAEAIRGAYQGLEDPEWRRTFLPKGRPPRVGERFTQGDLSRSLQSLADGGPREFYEGKIAEDIVEHSNRADGFFSSEDLGSYRAESAEPIETTYRGYTVYEQPPVSQGHILLEELNIVEGYDLSSLDPAGTDAVHLLIEAKKLAFEDRYRYSGDPEFIDLPMDRIISKGHAADRREMIDPLRAERRYGAGGFGEGDTTYFAVADSEGNGVSFIQSLFHGFGSGVVVPRTGIILNNRMTGFSLDPSSPNVLRGGKRTMHTLNTYMVFHEGVPLFIGGTPGGDTQVQTNLQIVTRLLDWGMNVQDAIEFPRWASGESTDLQLESRYPADTVRELVSRGHDVGTVGPWSGNGSVQLIMRHPETGAMIAGSDPRCDGMAVGI